VASVILIAGEALKTALWSTNDQVTEGDPEYLETALGIVREVNFCVYLRKLTINGPGFGEVFLSIVHADK